ncbi:MAG: methyltransferase domain-containing protein [Janthinobacterium lividum]
MSATQPLVGMSRPGQADAASRNPPCLVCGGVYEPSPLPGLFRCRSCGFTSADLSIPEETLSALYGEDYFHGQEYLDYVAEEDSLRLNFVNRLKTLRRLAPDWQQSDLFEIGCAYGFFLDLVRNEVRKASGIDVSHDAVTYARDRLDVDAVCDDYLTRDLGRQVDVIAMWDTIEHLKRPDLFIGKIASDLKPGGLVAITTGDLGSLNARLRGRSWRMIHPPTHMHYFSVATLSKLLQGHGLEVVHASHPGNSRRVRSVLYFLLSLKMKRPKLYAMLAKLPFTGTRLTVNLFDIMYVIARKRA